MFQELKLVRSLAVVAAIALYFATTQIAAARGGHGGGHHGGGHHGGGHHGGHHAGHHGGHNHHPYHPSHHHTSHHSHHHSGHHHSGHHDHHHHYAHHHHSWHHGGWGPGFWGGAALGTGLGYAYGNWGGWGYGGGGDTYVDNSTNVTPVSNEGDDSSDAADDSADANAQTAAADGSGQDGFPTDDWPELGVVTYAGQYGGSQGQVVVRVVPGSAADEAGVVPGDVILTFNGKPVPSADALDEAMNNAGGKFEIVVWDARTGRKSTLDGTLDPAAQAPTASETAATPSAQQ